MQSNTKNTDAINLSLRAKLWVASSAAITSLLCSSGVIAQDEGADAAIEEVTVTGIRSSLANALAEKRSSDNLVEVIQAVDIGKLPDQNLAEVLENITGVQITRSAGVGTGVQIRGTGANRVEINGVSTVGAGSGRGGISFEDIDASIVAAVEVTKAPEAKTTEGSVGGTINLRTIRPLDLKETLASVSVRGESSSLSTESNTPRLSGAYGQTWDTRYGEFGAVVSGSYTETDVSHFRPRVDRDNLNDCTVATPASYCPPGATHFLGVQFLNQVTDSQEYETKNLAASFELANSENSKFYFDAIFTDQERRQEGNRAQVSNVSRLNGSGDRAVDALGNPSPGNNTNFTAFETFNLGTLQGRDGPQNIGSILAVTQGTFSPLQQIADANGGRGAPFLRASSDASARLSENVNLRFGNEFTAGNLSGSVELSETSNDTVTPNFGMTLNFINPNSYISARDENGTPIEFDLSGGIAFGINFDDPFAPDVADLLNPANYVQDSGTYTSNRSANDDTVFRTDLSYDLEGKFDNGLDAITSVDFGYRHNIQKSVRTNSRASFGRTGNLIGSINGADFSELLVAAPGNFGDGTGSSLFIRDYLILNPELAVNPEQTIATLNAVTTAHNLANGTNTGLIGGLQDVPGAFYSAEETTNALYAQANFERGVVRGNVGFRYIQTDLDTSANVTDATGTSLVTLSSDYSHVLPRLNLVADVRDDVVLRLGYSEDINRPTFVQSSAARTFPGAGGVNANSIGGNPSLEPEEVQSFDISASWYFAPSAVASIGYFNKKRTNLFDQTVSAPEEINNLRDVVGPECEGGGIFSPLTEAGIFGNGETGVCVGDQSTFNSAGTTTQKGVELAFQYDLGEFEDRFGWASGFGFLANYTRQSQSGNETFNDIGFSRANAIYEAQGLSLPVNFQTELLNLSENAYNITTFYEKYGISARLRYTWRDAFKTNNLPGTGNVFTPLGNRGVQNARGQLNGSVSYDVNDKLTLALEGINLTESDADISCVNENALLCYRGITDRRVTFGASYKF